MQRPCENHPRTAATHRARGVVTDPLDPDTPPVMTIYVCEQCATVLRNSKATVNLERV